MSNLQIKDITPLVVVLALGVGIILGISVSTSWSQEDERAKVIQNLAAEVTASFPDIDPIHTVSTAMEDVPPTVMWSIKMVAVNAGKVYVMAENATAWHQVEITPDTQVVLIVDDWHSISPHAMVVCGPCEGEE
jgi:hypothetical protein